MPPVEQGAVITADGVYDRTQLNGFIDRFTNHCTDVLGSIGGDNERTRRQKADLFEQLEAIKHIPPDEPEGNLATPTLAVRDRLAAAADAALELAGGNKPWTRRHPDADARQFYAGMASTLMQLKRTALSAAAPSLAKSWAKRELDRMERSVPTIDYMSRSMLADDTGAGINHDFGPAGVGASFNRNRTFWFDDDRDANYWNGYSGSLSAAGPGSWLMALQILLSAEGGSVYFETDSMEELLRLLLNHDANHQALRVFMQSASPRMRDVFTKLRHIAQGLERGFLGRIHSEDPDKPHYLSDDKISKGANLTLLHLHARTLDQLSISLHSSNAEDGSDARQSGAFVQLLGQAFPTPSERVARGEGFPDPLAATIPDSDPLGHGKAPYRNYRLAATTGLGKFHDIASGVSTGAGGAATISSNLFLFLLKNVESSATLLDPIYHADPRLTFILLGQTVAERSGSPRLALFRQVMERFGTEADADLVLTHSDQEYYGPLDAIPECFRTAIAGPLSLEDARRRIYDLEQQCIRLHRTYIDFMSSAAVIAAKPDRFTHKTAIPMLDRIRQRVFGTINDAIWGDRSGKAGYPPGMQKALKNPDRFIAASHDAIGLALGLAGIYLAIAKRRMAQLAAAQESSQRDDYARAIYDADTAYMTAKMALVQTGLPLKRASVFLTDPTFQDRGTSRRFNAVGQISGSGGVPVNIPETIVEQAGENMAGNSISTAAGTATGTIRIRLQHADLQINPSRQGQYVEAKVTFTAGAPMLGQALVGTLMHALQKVYLNSSDPRAWERQRASLAEQLQGLACNVSAGAGVTVRLRRFPNAAPLDFRLQFVQLHDQKTGGASVGIPLPHPAGVTALGLNRQQTLQNVVTEYMGPDIGYLMLQHKKLERVMKHAGSIAAEHDAVENDVLKAIFTGNTDPDASWRDAIFANHGGSWVAESYFGIGSMIPRVIDEYLAYLNSADQTEEAVQSADSPDDAHFFSEFQRYFDSRSEDEPFRRVAETAMEAKHYAPGSTFHAQIGTGERVDPFVVPPSLRTPVAAPNLSSDWNWEQQRAVIMGLRTLQERIDYYCSEQGRPVLDWFIHIVERARAIHNLSRHRAVKTRHGFQTSLKNQVGNRRVLVKKNKPEALTAVHSRSRLTA